MSRVGQISIARPGLPLQLRFEVQDLKSTVEQDAQPGDHVTLYPGDYTEWYDYEDSPFDEDTTIEIKEGVNLTILPGAKVQYKESGYTDNKGFRYEDYSHEGNPVDSLDNSGNKLHPLSTDSPIRYESPRFVGHIENISDTNLASEWAFKTDVQSLRENFLDLKERGTTVAVTTDTQPQEPDLKLGQKLTFQEGPNVKINVGNTSDDEGNKTGVGVNVEFDKNSIAEVDGGRNINTNNVDGEVEVNHDLIFTTGTPSNTGSRFIQSLVLNNGHIKEIDANEVATVNNREPRPDDGEDGDIWFTKTRDFLIDIFMSSDDPSDLNGEEGDIWLVDSSLERNFRKAGYFFFSDSGPDSSEGEDGAVWLNIDGWSGTDFESEQIDEIVYNEFTPNDSEGTEGDIQATNITRV